MVYAQVNHGNGDRIICKIRSWKDIAITRHGLVQFKAISTDGTFIMYTTAMTNVIFRETANDETEVGWKILGE